MPGRSRGGGPRSRRIGTASRQNGALISRCVLAPLEDLETAAVDREPASASGPPSSSTSTSRAVPRVPRPTRAGRPSRARAQRAPALLRPGEAASRLASPTPTLTQVRHPRGVQPPRTGEDASIEAALLARAARIEASAPPPFRALLDDAIAQRRETIRRGISWPWASSSALGTTDGRPNCRTARTFTVPAPKTFRETGRLIIDRARGDAHATRGSAAGTRASVSAEPVRLHCDRAFLRTAVCCSHLVASPRAHDSGPGVGRVHHVRVHRGRQSDLAYARSAAIGPVQSAASPNVGVGAPIASARLSSRSL